MLQCQSNLTMTTINAKGERQLSQQQLTEVIQSYLGAALFKHAVQYESVTHYHAQYLDFAYEKVPLQSNLPTQQEKYVFPSLFQDADIKLVLTMHLVRILQYDHKLICLAFDNTVTMTDQRFFILTLVFKNKETATAWKNQYSFLTQIKVAQPFRTTHKISMHNDTTMLITRPENIRVQSKFNLESYNPEQVRARGNNKFRERKYIQALIQYELGLGLMHAPSTRRDRAILYANSSQCLFEMRLFEAALIYAGIACSIDNKYTKGLYRRLICLLQLKQMKQLPMAMRAIDQASSPEEYQKAHEVFLRHNLHHHGIFDWKEIFKGANLNFGEYISTKVGVLKDQGHVPFGFQPFRWNFVAKETIHQYELVLFCKPLIYKPADQQRFGENYTSMIRQILTYCDYEDLFFQKFQELPSQNQIQGHILKVNYKDKLQGVEMNEIHAKCLRCLELQKLIHKAQGKQFLGIWEELYQFKQECMSNCTYIHIKGGLAVFALKDIQQGDFLTIDFLNWETSKRASLMEEKLGISCDCVFCNWEWDQDLALRSGEILYTFYKHNEAQWKQQGYEKMSLFFLWNLIFVKQFNEVQLMKEYLLLLERYPVWQCVINCLKYLQLRKKNDAFDHIKSTIKRCFEKYFRMTHTQAVELLKNIL